MDLGDDLDDFGMGTGDDPEPISLSIVDDPTTVQGRDPGENSVSAETRHNAFDRLAGILPSDADLDDDGGAKAAADAFIYKRRRGEPHPMDYYLNSNDGDSLQDIRKAKKARMEQANYDEMTAKLALIRAEAAAAAAPVTGRRGPKGGRLHSSPPDNAGNWIPLSAPDARKRFYIVTKPEIDVNQGSEDKRTQSTLLDTHSYKELLQKAYDIQDAKVAALKEAQLESTVEELPEMDTPGMDEESLLAELSGTAPAAPKAVPQPKIATVPIPLWVQKYQPKSFADLLSDDGVNRTVLSWLKLWDECVFRRKIPKAPSPLKKLKEGANKKPWFKTGPDELPRELDKHKRPFHKVILLSGTAGLGKTTLAHVAGRAAGYRVMELNASDDRSLEAFKGGIEKATQYSASLDEDPRPNCLVIDEIDGAPAPSVNYLVNLVKGEGPETSKKKKKKPTILRRPIICICNDLYTPALRELRKVALVIAFPPTQPGRLAERLRFVCGREALSAEHRTLERLAQQAELDIRSCLNTLQFSARRIEGKDRLRLDPEDLEAAIGQKDDRGGLFSAWKTVFTADKEPMEMGRLWHRVTAMGEEDRLQAGLLDNFPLCQTRDPTLTRSCSLSRWLIFGDRLGRMVGERQEYVLHRYSGAVPVAAHGLFAASNPHKIAFPHSLAELRQCREKSQCIYRSVVEGGKVGSGGLGLVLGTLPLLARILRPGFRPVNTQLYSAKEKEELKCLVAVMLQFNLTYRQQRSVDNQFTFVLEPDIDALVEFSGLEKLVVRRQLSYSAKQMIVREVETERIRRAEAWTHRGCEDAVSEAAEETAPGGRKLIPVAATTNHLQRVTPTSARPAPATHVPRSFFTGAKEEKVLAAAPPKPRTGVWYKFTPGFSNAVRRNLRMKDFI